MSPEIHDRDERSHIDRAVGESRPDVAVADLIARLARFTDISGNAERVEIEATFGEDRLDD
ncbi:hypothetical protein [Nocardia bovistercoris]|uniref:Uncharacterized protein n=1 Tax=Nocardia bovistercoris TaxID=2785916 RepID=A0A931N3D5_9NOCA|nr:hypothetical protein [Nocardia bovistercoris]MBH0777036.1 hypothetical protein [Nocardia bovistercoris]